MVQLALKLHPPELQPIPKMLIGSQPNKDKRLPRILTVTGKSCPFSRFVKKPKKATKFRTPKHKATTIDRETNQLVHFNQKPSVLVWNAEKATACCATKYHVKGKITLSALGTP